MRRPIGLYLAEFGTAAGDAAPLVMSRANRAAPVYRPLGAAVLPLPPPAADLPPAPVAETPILLPSPAAEAAAPDIGDIVAALQADHAAALAEARQQWAEAEGTALALALDTALGKLEIRILDILAPMVEPFLREGARRQVVDGLREALGVVLRSRNGQTVAVTGPADLLSALEAAHPGEPTLVYEVAETPDVTIAAGETLVRSHLAGWAAALDLSLGDRP